MIDLLSYVPLMISVPEWAILILANRKYKRLTRGDSVFWCIIILVLTTYLWLILGPA